MSYEERKRLIAELQNVRHSRVLCFVLSDREAFPAAIPGFAPTMASDSLLRVRDLLHEIGRVEQLDLFLYTRGGAVETVWPLVTNLRSHCERLSILVPYRAHSAGTMLCLGADELLMSDGAELSPIDPTTGNPFNPRDPTNQANQFGISVEDVTAYFDFARTVAGISQEQYVLDVLKQLTSQVHPLAVGNVQRVYLLIGRLARELLALHLNRDDQLFEAIVSGLTTRFYSHLHAISRLEAQSLLGDKWVRAPATTEAAAIDPLFRAFSNDLHLEEKFNLPDEMGDQPSLSVRAIGGFIETDSRSFVHETRVNVMQRPQLPQGIQLQVAPGQTVPLAPWAGRLYDFGTQATGWIPNTEDL